MIGWALLERIQEISPRIIMASIKGFGPENIKTVRYMRMWRNVLVDRHQPPDFMMVHMAGAQIGDSGTDCIYVLVL